MLPVVTASVLAAARSWSSLTLATSVFAFSPPPNQPPPMPDVSDDMLHPASAASKAHPVMQTVVLRPDCVTTPLSEHLPGLLQTVIPYAIEPCRRRLATVRRLDCNIRKA